MGVPGPAALHAAPFDYADFALRLGLDIAALAVFMAAVRMRRAARSDLATVICCFNVGLLIVLTVIATSASATAIGFGLFAMLSIIRLRSEPFNNNELAIFFAALVLALINGVIVGDLPLTVVLDVVVVVTVLLAAHPRVAPVAHQQEITLDCVHNDDAALRADLEHRLGIHVLSFTVLEVDFVRDVTRVSIRFRSATRGAPLPVGA